MANLEQQKIEADKEHKTEEVRERHKQMEKLKFEILGSNLKIQRLTQIITDLQNI